MQTASGAPELDTRINPQLWLARWPLLNTNRHSEAMEEEKVALLSPRPSAHPPFIPGRLKAVGWHGIASPAQIQSSA